MAERPSVFAFWQEKERNAIKKEEPNHQKTQTKLNPVATRANNEIQSGPHKPQLPGHHHINNNSKDNSTQDSTSRHPLPATNHTSNTSSRNTIFPTSLSSSGLAHSKTLPTNTHQSPERATEIPHKSLNRSRPHSVIALSQRFETASTSTKGSVSTGIGQSQCVPSDCSHPNLESRPSTGNIIKPRPSIQAMNSNTAPSNISKPQMVSFDDPSDDDVDHGGQRIPPHSAPPTMDRHRSSSLQWKGSTGLHKPSRGFISYIEDISDDSVEDILPAIADLEEKGKPITRSSPVIKTKPSKIRHPSAVNARKETVRVVLRKRKVLTDPLLDEVEAFWQIVKRIISDKVKESNYLTSPTISRFNPQSGSPQAATIINQPIEVPRKGSLFSGSASSKILEVTLIVEFGPIVKGEESIEVPCTGNILVSVAIEKTVDLIRRTHPNVARGQHNYQLKVCGKDEYFESDRCLVDYQYTHYCIKLNVPISLVLMERSFVKQIVSRTSTVNSEMPGIFAMYALSFHEFTTIIDSYFSKDEEFHGLLSKPPVNYSRMCHQTVACVKHICERIGFLETVRVSEAVFDLQRACQAFKGSDDFSMSIQVDREHFNNRSSTIDAGYLKQARDQARDETALDVASTLNRLKEAVKEMIELYCQYHHSTYEPIWLEEQPTSTFSTDPEMKLRVNVRGLHRFPVQDFMNYAKFKIEVGLYHGGKPICKKVFSPPAKIERKFFSTIIWNKWIKTSLPLTQIPREAKVCFTLYGLNPPTNPKEYRDTLEPLAWVSKQLFSSNGKLVSGSCLLGMWKDDSPADPTGTSDSYMEKRKCLILEVDFDDNHYQYGVVSSLTVPNSSSVPPVLSPVRPAPPQAIAKNMQDFVSKDRFERLQDEDLRLVWSHRNSLPTLIASFARGLPIFAQSIPSWSHPDQVAKLHALLSQWPVIDPAHGLELLDPQYSDMKVREKACEMIDEFCEDDFLDLLPQILQSLKHDSYMDSSMHELLLKQAIASPRTAHYLYWNLVPLTLDRHFGWRYQLLLSAVMAASGEELSMELAQQSEFIQSLADIAVAVKNSRDVQRQTCLVQSLQEFASTLPPVFRLPLNPALQCCDIELESCSFFNSKTVPLKLSFKNADPFGNNIQVIFKTGDDLRQDMLALQLMQLMDKIWLRAGLDLRLILYQVLATGEDQGFVELVTESATLRQIHTEHGVTGSFKDKPLWEWLMRHNSSDTAWKRAIENFTHSCAGCCVATYVLGICDRHNDNIMVKKSGHMFHIDFGKILGNAQMFGSIKRDRAPFVLTPDMAYVINAGDKPSVRFQKFTDLCCAAYNELRKHSHLFLSLLSLLLTSNLPELSSVDDIKYFRDALLPSATEEEATFYFTKHIEASLSSLSTQINFFIHNLAQYKFSTPTTSHGLLSFSPSSYSIFTDGKIASAVVVAYHLRYFPEKYIVYQIQVHRQGDCNKPDTTLFRRYSEFNELQNKLLESFPEENLPSLPGKTYLPGQSRAKETSERRREYLNNYISSLLSLSPEISESDVVYTFLHCLLRDEQDLIKMREDEQALVDGRSAGKVKLDLRYNEQSKRFTIIVQHVQSLVPREGAESTDPYVKLYLTPDPNKLTKLKTKIARKTLNPTYNEMLHYSISVSELKSKSLQLTVWDASSRLSKECLGIVIIELEPMYRDLIKGCVQWFELQSANFTNR